MNERLTITGTRVNQTASGYNLPDAPAWLNDALCTQVDPELFHPEKGGSSRKAKEVCGGCDVREQCLAWAVEHNEFGVWGGLSERERRKLRNPTGQRARPAA